VLTRLLIAINVIVFVLEYLTGSPDQGTGIAGGGDLIGTAVLNGQWWRIVTSAFLHENLIHITFNMIALWQVGTIVEMLLGTPRTFVIYVASMFGSGLAVTYFDTQTPTIGASGAIFGLFGALVAAGLRLGPRGTQLVRQCLGIIVLNVLLGFMPGLNISQAGHIGGLVVGFVVGAVLFVNRLRPQPEAHPVYARPIDPRRDPGVVTIDQPPEPPQPPVHP
jgi:membrane associated rhomboid family serine protease